MKKIYSLILVLFLAGCAMPIKQVSTMTSQASLAFPGAPQESVLIIDDLSVSSLHLYDGKKQVLRVEPGTHKVVVKDSNGAVLYSETIFVGDNLKIIEIS